jgi:NAD(P)H dehydrogenase (quinone)
MTEASDFVIAVTGASGPVGRRVVQSLTSEADVRVRALTRSPERLSALPVGSVATYVDYEDSASLREAFQTVDSVVFISSDGDIDTMRAHHQNVVQALAESDVRHVTYMSILDAERNSPFYYASVHRETEGRLAELDADVCIVRTSVFMDFFAETFIERNVVNLLPMPSGTISFVSKMDTANCIASLSLKRETGVTLATGPTSLSMEQVNGILNRSTHDGRLGVISHNEYVDRLRSGGHPEWIVQAFSSMFQSIQEGRFSTVSNDISRVIGREPESFADFFDRGALLPPIARGRSISNWQMFYTS